ncbi:MAG: hypothetical protein ABEK50_16000 [bacterium]
MSKKTTITLLDEDDQYTVSGQVSANQALVDENDFRQATGWELKEEGLCKKDACYPVDDRASLKENGQINLRGFAEKLNRSMALETDPAVVYLGPENRTIKENLQSGKAPDFTLPDWKNEEMISLSDFEGNKIFLLVWASW